MIVQYATAGCASDYTAARSLESSQSFVTRHWRGELSLGVSFGLNLCVLGTALSGAVNAIAARVPLTTMPRIGAVAIIGFE